MTFALKDFYILKKEFNDKVTVILKREQLEKELKDLPKVEDLPPRRRDEILFLNSVLTQLDAQKLSSHAKAAVFYGAMLLIQRDIERNLNTQGINILARLETTNNSLLYTSLNEVMNKSVTNLPTNLQLADFYKEINGFLLRIFNDNDSRNGFNIAHPLLTIPFERLADLANTSYKMEEMVAKAAIAEMDKDGKTRPDPIFRAKEVPEAITKSLGTWDELKKSLETLIQDERASKNKATVKALSPERATQLQFLQTVSQTLSEKSWGIKDPQKVAILAGCMYLVREQIRTAEYKKSSLSRDDIAKGLLSSGSVVHDKLTEILNAKQESVENIEALVAVSNQYIHHMSIEKTEDKNVVKNIVRARHVFSDIAGFELLSFLNLAQRMVKTCRIQALHRCVTDVKKDIEAAQPKEASSSYFSSAYGWFTKKTSKAEEDDDEEEELEDPKEASTSSAGPV